MKNLRPIPNVFPLQPFVETAFGFDREILVWETGSKTTEMYPPVSQNSLANIKSPLDHIIEQQGNDNESVKIKKYKNI